MKIIEIAAFKVRSGMIIDTFETLVNPGISIPADASAINGIFDSDVADAPDINAVKICGFYRG